MNDAQKLYSEKTWADLKARADAAGLVPLLLLAADLAESRLGAVGLLISSVVSDADAEQLLTDALDELRHRREMKRLVRLFDGRPVSDDS